MSTRREGSRLLLMTETYWPEIGGGESQARSLAQALLRRGHEVTVMTRRSRSTLPWRERDGNVLVLRLPPSGPGRWRKWLLLAPALTVLLWRHRRYDLVLVAGFRILGIPALLARAVTGKPTVLKADSRGELSGEYFRAGLARARLAPESPLVRGFLAARNALLRSAQAHVALSQEAACELLEHRVREERIRVIGNGVDTDRFRPALSEERTTLRARLDLPRDAAIVIYTGRLVSYKGLPVLLDAWPAILMAQPQALLVLVGEGGGDIHACEPALRERVRDQQLGSSVRFAGSVENVDDWLRAADAFAFPTEDEAFGLSLVEAMACALPAVTTAVGGLRDFVDDQVNALVIEPGDAAALADALRTLLGNAGLRQSIGHAARQTAVQRFGVDAIADAYVRLFDDLVDAPVNASSTGT
jgi:glycosyltransferase involved in cell wall biosynthesis